MLLGCEPAGTIPGGRPQEVVVVSRRSSSTLLGDLAQLQSTRLWVHLVRSNSKAAWISSRNRRRSLLKTGSEGKQFEVLGSLHIARSLRSFECIECFLSVWTTRNLFGVMAAR